MARKYPITQEGLEVKKARLAEVERQLFYVLPLMIKEASRYETIGKENCAWLELQELKAKLEEERKFLLELIWNAAVIAIKGNPRVVEHGIWATIEWPSKKRTKVQIVNSAEADPASGKISDQSPVGQAIFGRRRGERVRFQTPKGLQSLKILTLSAQ